MVVVGIIYGAELPMDPSDFSDLEWGFLGKKRASKVVLPEPGKCRPYYKLDHRKLKLIQYLQSRDQIDSQHACYT